MKKTNDLFRQKLKELNEKVEKAIEKTYVKRILAAKKKKPNVDINHRIAVKDKEIENAEKQIEGYKKEIDALNIKIDEMSQVDAMLDKEQGVKDHKAAISELRKLIKDLEKQSKDKGKELEKLTEGNDYNYKIRNMIDEIRMWKEKIRHRQEVYDQANNTVQLKSERLETLEKENASLMSKIESMNSNIDLSQNNSKPGKVKKELDTIGKEKQKAKEKFEQAQLQNRNEIKAEEKEIQDLESQRDDLLTKLKELDQEKRISTFKLKEVGRVLKHNQLKPLSPVKHGSAKESKRSETTRKSMKQHRGSTTNLMSVKNAKEKPVEEKTLSKNENTQSSQILIKKKKMMIKNNKNESDEDFEKNQVIDYDKFQKQQKKKDNDNLAQLKIKGPKGTFETKITLK